MMERRTGLVLAADIPYNRMAKLPGIAKYVDAVKVGYIPILYDGLEIISKLQKNFKLICDLKIADIPYISGKICEILFTHGAYGAIVHGFVGRDTVKECVRIASQYDGEIYVVSEMSHEGSVEFITQHSEKIAEISRECGAHGIIAPGTRADRIKILKEISGLQVFAPGLGAQGGSIVDAVRNGADFIIAGRSIYESENPERSAEEIVNKIKEGKIAENNNL